MHLSAPKSHNRNRSDFRVDGAKSPDIPQKEGALRSEIAARNRKSLATFNRTLTSQCSIAFSCFRNRCGFWGPRWASQSQKSQQSLRFCCAKSCTLSGPPRLRVQSRSRTWLRIAASITFLLRTCFKGVLDTIAPLSRG